jgi:hypothetical protein
MSAFMVSKAHVDALVGVALNGPRDAESRWEGGPRWAAFDPRETHWQEQEWRQVALYGTGNCSVKPVAPSDLGDLLVIENVRSITARYPDTLDGEPMPGPIDAYWDAPYSYAPGRRLTCAEALKAIDCYEYQACEHDEWADSEAKRFCDGLRASIVGVLPGYSAAPWEIDTTHA